MVIVFDKVIETNFLRMEIFDNPAQSNPLHEALKFDVYHILTKTIKFEADDLRECLGLINFDNVHSFIHQGQNLLG